MNKSKSSSGLESIRRSLLRRLPAVLAASFPFASFGQTVAYEPFAELPSLGSAALVAMSGNNAAYASRLGEGMRMHNGRYMALQWWGGGSKPGDYNGNNRLDEDELARMQFQKFSNVYSSGSSGYKRMIAVAPSHPSNTYYQSLVATNPNQGKEVAQNLVSTFYGAGSRVYPLFAKVEGQDTGTSSVLYSAATVDDDLPLLGAMAGSYSNAVTEENQEEATDDVNENLKKLEAMTLLSWEELDSTHNLYLSLDTGGTGMSCEEARQDSIASGALGGFPASIQDTLPEETTSTTYYGENHSNYTHSSFFERFPYAVETDSPAEDEELIVYMGGVSVTRKYEHYSDTNPYEEEEGVTLDSAPGIEFDENFHKVSKEDLSFSEVSGHTVIELAKDVEPDFGDSCPGDEDEEHMAGWVIEGLRIYTGLSFDEAPDCIPKPKEDCEEDCAVACSNAAEADNCSIQMMLPLGRAVGGHTAGYLYLKRNNPLNGDGEYDDAIYSPRHLMAVVNSDAIGDPLFGGSGLGTTVIRNMDSNSEDYMAVAQVWTGRQLIDLVEVGDGYEARYYEEDQVDFVAGQVPLDIPGGVVARRYQIKSGEVDKPLQKVIVQKAGTGDGSGADSSQANLRVVQENRIGSGATYEVARAFFFGHDETSNDTGWTLVEGKALAGVAISSLDLDSLPTSGDLSRFEKVTGETSEGYEIEGERVYAADGTTILREEVTHYDIVNSQRVPVARIQDPSGLALTESWTYDEDSQSSSFGKALTYVAPSGYWEFYGYDGAGVLNKKVMQKGDVAFNPLADIATLESTHVVEDHSSSVVTVSGAEDVTVFESRVTDAGVLASQSFKIVRGVTNIPAVSTSIIGDTPLAGDVIETWDVQVVNGQVHGGESTATALIANLLAGTNPNGHRIRKSWAYAAGHADEFLTRCTESSDGRVTVYERLGIDDSGTPGDPEDDVVLSVMTRGYVDQGSIDYGTRTKTAESIDGVRMWSSMERIDPDVNSGNWFVDSLQATTNTDAQGRPTETSYFFGSSALSAKSGLESGTPANPANAAYKTSKVYGCCDVESSTDRYGLETGYVYDDLQRQVMMSRPGGESGVVDAEVVTHTTYDAADRVIRVEQEGSDMNLGLARETSYDTIGRVVKESYLEEVVSGVETFKHNFYTYRYVKPDGSAYDPQVDSGSFYSETRMYPHDASSGAVEITWRDSKGLAVLSLAGTVATDWGGAEPSSIEALASVLTRTEVDYDAFGRVAETREYHDLGALPGLDALATPSGAVAGTNYIVQVGDVYDFQGRRVKSEDVSGNVMVYVYDNDGRVTEIWMGTDDGSPVSAEAYHDPSTLSGSNLVQISAVIYDAYGRVDSSSGLKPLADALAVSNFSTASVSSDGELKYITAGGSVSGRESWSKPQDAMTPWSKREYDERGRMLLSKTYANSNNSQGALIAQTENIYSSSTDRLEATRVYSVENGAAGSFLETTYDYDAAGRQARTTGPTGAFTVNLYDALGRVESTLRCTKDITVDVNDLFNPTDFIVVSEQVNYYNEAGQVVMTVSLDRHHDDETSQGRLWDEGAEAPVSFAEARYAGVWYDAAGRVTHTADYGNTPPQVQP